MTLVSRKNSRPGPRYVFETWNSTSFVRYSSRDLWKTSLSPFLVRFVAWSQSLGLFNRARHGPRLLDGARYSRGWSSYVYSSQKHKTGWWFGIIVVIFPYIGNNHPNWLSYFQRGGSTTNQLWWKMPDWNYLEGSRISSWQPEAFVVEAGNLWFNVMVWDLEADRDSPCRDKGRMEGWNRLALYPSAKGHSCELRWSRNYTLVIKDGNGKSPMNNYEWRFY